LNVVKAVIPPLRERQEDIPLLINHFIRKCTEESGAPSRVKGISKEAARILCDHSWNGNVRELENVIERSVIFASGEVITPAELPPRMRQISVKHPGSGRHTRRGGPGGNPGCC
jgi:two-component system, NtrC family, response regulator